MCGILAISDHRLAARTGYLALFSMQHRGQESAGMATSNGAFLKMHRGMGLVQEVFTANALAGLDGRAVIGHVRYSTAGASMVENAQPLVMAGTQGRMAVAHNGNITNAEELRRELEQSGALFHGTSDTEVVLHLVAREGGPTTANILRALGRLQGAYSLVCLIPEGDRTAVMAVRDPWGFRPLVMGRVHGGVVFASETCALDIMNARFERELEPGEAVIARGSKVEVLRPFAERRHAACVFEQIYFARPDSHVFGSLVYNARRAMGRQLAREMGKRNVDLVVPVPDSGVPAALGFSEESGVRMEMALIRNHYVGRTFIQPHQLLRESSVKMKLHPMRELLAGKRIVLVDDSIVRGTTSRNIVRLLRRVRVKEVHMAISSPPIVGPCFYGIDTPEEDKLIAARMPSKDIAGYLGVDSLLHLSLDGLLKAAQGSTKGLHHCTACFTKEHPTGLIPLGSVGRTSISLENPPPA